MDLNRIETHEFLRRNLSGLKANTQILFTNDKDQLENIFWYNPEILSIEYDYWKEIDFKKIDFPKIVNLVRERLELGIVFNIYKNSRCIYRTQVDNIPVKYEDRSSGILSPFSAFDKRQYNGLTFTFPSLEEGKYNFEVVEYWTIGQNEPVTRKISFPVHVSDFKSSFINTKETESKLQDALNFSNNTVFDLSRDVKEFGNQSIALITSNIPLLYIDQANQIMFSRFYGTDDALFESIRMLYSPTSTVAVNSQIWYLEDIFVQNMNWSLLRDCLASNLQVIATSNSLKTDNPIQWPNSTAPLNFKDQSSFIAYSSPRENIQRYVSPYNLLSSAVYPETRLIWKKKLLSQNMSKFDFNVELSAVSLPKMVIENEAK